MHPKRPQLLPMNRFVHHDTAMWRVLCLRWTRMFGTR